METTPTFSKTVVKKEGSKVDLSVPLTETYRKGGKDLFARAYDLANAIEKQKEYEIWLYFKSTLKTPSATTKGHDVYGNVFEGPNFATQDYLGLSSNMETREIAAKVTKEFGVHSGGAALAFGTHPYYLDFQREISEYWGVKSSIIYSAGWMAGYGIVKGLIRPWDHIIIDKLAHNCLSEGARAATQNIHVCDHLSVEQMVEAMKKIREEDNENGILIVTESLFSMDSDTPDLVYLQKESLKYDAFLLIDMAHDLGAIGEKGLGALETQGLKDYTNVVLMGSGSKTLSTNIGFAGCNDERVIEYLRYFSPPYMFSNVVAPPQCAAALNNLRILRSDQGVQLRKQVMANSVYLRDHLQAKGYEVLGNPSPIVILILGDEVFCRIVVRLMLDNNVIVNGIEFPIVAKGKARLRLQLQATHTKEHLDTFLHQLESCSAKALTLMDNVENFVNYRKNAPKL
jgi:glycine C-acetyltransferase